jgi:hypothetical protein
MTGLLKKIKKAYNVFLKNLAQENVKAFGNGKLDCCELSKKTNK